jgi:H+/Cl- antiporter ClcA
MASPNPEPPWSRSRASSRRVNRSNTRRRCPWTADLGRRAFAVAVLAATLLQPLRLLPGGSDVELQNPWWLHVLTALYPLLAVSWVVLVLAELRRRPHEEASASTSERAREAWRTIPGLVSQ